MAKSRNAKDKDEKLINVLSKIEANLDLRKQIEEEEPMLVNDIRQQLRRVFIERMSKIKWSGQLYAKVCGWFYVENVEEVFPELNIEKFRDYISFNLDDIKIWPYGLTVYYSKGKITLNVCYFNEESTQKRMEKLGLTFENLGIVKKTNVSYELANGN